MQGCLANVAKAAWAFLLTPPIIPTLQYSHKSHSSLHAPHAAHPWLIALDGLIITSENKSHARIPKKLKNQFIPIVSCVAQCVACWKMWLRTATLREVLEQNVKWLWNSFCYGTLVCDAGWSTNGNVAKLGGLIGSSCHQPCFFQCARPSWGSSPLQTHLSP